jgi:capsular polysaccharide biosynthesis protein
VNLKEFLAAVRRYWLTFVLTTAVIFALGLTWLLLSPAKFVSSTQLMVSIEGFTTAAAYENDQVVERRINTYIPLLTSGVVTQRVIDKLNLPLTSAELADRISATNVPPKTSIIDVQVTDDSPAGAQLLAKTLATEFVNYVEALETPTGSDSQKVRTTVVTAASEARQQRVERILLGVVAGLAALVGGAVAVWIRRRTDPIVRSAEQAAVAGVPVLGCVTAAREASLDDLGPYRGLRTRLQSMTNRTGETDDRGRVTMLTSTVGEVDTALVASRLGRVMESAGSHSIVLDTRVGQPEVATHQPFAATASSNKPNPGSAEDTDESANDTTEPNDRAPIDATPAPKPAPPESEYGADESPDASSVSAWAADPGLLVGEATPELIDHLRDEYEQILIAAAPVLSADGASTLTDFAEAVLLVLSIGETIRRDLSRTAEKLRTIGAPPTGAVLVGKEDSCSQSNGRESLRKFLIRNQKTVAIGSLTSAENPAAR